MKNKSNCISISLINMSINALCFYNNKARGVQWNIFSLGDFNMINNISDQASSFPGTQLNQSDNFLDSLREFFAILNSSRKGELSTWDTIYLHLILAINADSDLIKMMSC